MIIQLEVYRQQLNQELHNILNWWIQHTIDQENGGFYGKIDHHNKVYPGAPKGSVLNARILWAFSAAYQLTALPVYKETAERAYQYFISHFIDNENGGVYWTVDYKGRPLDTKKQFYALSFAVYAFSEYYRCSGDSKAKETAIQLYKHIVQHSYDKEYGGYIEALSQTWQPLSDSRLSSKDANEKKSMNTHLHVLEAFTTLYRVWPDAALRSRIEELVLIFHHKILNAGSDHLQLFFDMNWQVKGDIISYGHDIEAAWLVPEAAEVIDNPVLTAQVNQRAVQVAIAVVDGVDADGGLWYEYEPAISKLVRQKHSWPQAEAMVGFFNAWQISGNELFLQRSIENWQFVQQHIIDQKEGEWVWGVEENYSIMTHEDKAGLWKCPYHNSRACIEIINRINKLQ